MFGVSYRHEAPPARLGHPAVVTEPHSVASAVNTTRLESLYVGTAASDIFSSNGTERTRNRDHVTRVRQRR